MSLVTSAKLYCSKKGFDKNLVLYLGIPLGVKTNYIVELT
jgi:hypothetical protein